MLARGAMCASEVPGVLPLVHHYSKGRIQVRSRLPSSSGAPKNALRAVLAHVPTLAYSPFSSLASRSVSHVEGCPLAMRLKSTTIQFLPYTRWILP